jgi:hypothetical protein
MTVQGNFKAIENGGIPKPEIEHKLNGYRDISIQIRRIRKQV